MHSSIVLGKNFKVYGLQVYLCSKLSLPLLPRSRMSYFSHCDVVSASLIRSSTGRCSREEGNLYPVLRTVSIHSENLSSICCLLFFLLFIYFEF